MQTPPPFPPKRKGDWWSRNWKWLVPLTVLAFVACITGFIFFVMTIMKSSDAYKGALLRVKNSPAVIEALGSPVTEGILLGGNVNVAGPTGNANLRIPVSGPKGSATVDVSATKSAGLWQFNRLLVQIDGSGRTIDLSDGNKTPAERPDN